MVEPVVCPVCAGRKVVKRGKRQVAFGTVQLYQCKGCGRSFSESRLKQRSYPPSVVRWALQYYCMGLTVEETRRRVNKRFKIKVSESSIHRWIQDHAVLIPVQRRREVVRQYDPLLAKQSFFHQNLEYVFMLHRYKMDMLVKQRFPGLYRYICGFESGCPDAFFQLGLRCSKPVFEVSVDTRHRRNLSCKMAGFAIQSRRSNRERHGLVEEFMLLCDSATVAVEVPVWYWEKSVDRGVTGHIDVVQIRGGKVFIMDYKPGAVREKKAVQQLYQYATALSFRAGVPFECIGCAWFDHEEYFEFIPHRAEARLIR